MSQENNFVPEQENYKPLSPFKMFVKSNFPFIEATFEALDNYGLYCKVVEYLNDVIENENTVEDNVTALYNAFVNLNNYVSNYFDNLDVQEEINNKLDEMASTGVLQELLKEQYEALETEVNETIANNNTLQNNKINQNTTNISALSARMDGFTHLAAGSTTGDAELEDIRVMFNGTTKSSAGSAVRSADELLYNMFKNTAYSNNSGIFTSQAVVSPYDDLNTFPINEIGCYGNAVLSLIDNVPGNFTTGFVIVSFNYTSISRDALCQICIDFNASCLAYRMYISSAWTSWKYLKDNESRISQILSDIYKLQISDNFQNYMLGSHDYLPDTTLTENSIINHENGNVISNQYTNGYAVTDYIDIDYLDYVGLGFVRGRDLCGGALYDSSKNFICAIWGSSDWQYPSENYNAPFNFVNTFKDAKYLRYNVTLNSFLPRSKNYVYVASNNLNKLDLLNEPIFYVGSGRTGTNTFTTLKACCDYIKNNDVMNAKVYVDSGTYDLVDEFTEEYLDSVEQTQNHYLGLMIGNNTHFIFDENAKVVFNYDGANEPTVEFFSPFNIIGSVTIENANIEVTNARYCVHEDIGAYTGTKPESMIVKYINCKMKHNGDTASSGSHSGYVAIGGGCSRNSLSIIEGGEYTGSWVDGDISYHNYSGNIDSKVVIKNAWIYNKIRLSTMSTSHVDCEISGNRFDNDFTFNSSYFTVKKWNNIIE